MRRGADRSCTTTGWLTSWHSFSYGPWYDPDNVGFGRLVVSNHDVLAPGAGFDDHQHHGVDLVTYVVSGSLAHRDSTGHEAVVSAGELQVLRAGAGVTHSERNASATEPVEYVQMWLRTEDPAVSYGLPPIGGEPPDSLLAVLPSGAALWRYRLRGSGLRGRHEQIGFAGSTGSVALRVHLYVLSGTARLGDIRLVPGDAVRVTDEAVPLAADGPQCEVLGWTLPA